MAPCMPVRLRQIDPSRVTFALRCGRREYPDWGAVRRGGEVAIIAGRRGPGLSPARVHALKVPVFVAWRMNGVGKWPE